MIRRLQKYLSCVFTRERFFAFMIVAGFEILSSQVVSKQWGLLYAPACLAFCLLELSVIMSFKPTSLFVDLAKLAGWQATMQVFGGITKCAKELFKIYHWQGIEFFSVPYFVYNWGIHALVIATIIRLLMVGKYDGHSKNNSHHRIFDLGAVMGNQQDTRVHQ